MKRHQFEQHARHFRSGRISLNQLTELVFGDTKEVVAVGQSQSEEVIVATVENELPIPLLRQRPVDAHKGDFGRVLLIGGSASMPGAISLSAMAALRSGSGLVTAAAPESIAHVVAGFDPCIMTLPCRDSNGSFSSVTEELKKHLNSADAIALGPGMGREVDRYFLQPILESPKPLVIDADGIHVLADSHSLFANREAATVLTPHPGEFSNLANTEFSNRQAMETAAKHFAAEKNCLIVLKGHQTLVTDGSREYRNASGNVGMATAGSGDVLTGVITSLIGQGYDAFDAAVLGVHLHGRAGDFAAEELGTVSMVATDLLDSLAAAFNSRISPTAEPELRIGF